MILKQFERYCNQTSIHGCRYVFTEPSLFKRSFAVFVIVSMTSAAAYLLAIEYMEFRQATTMTTILTTTAPLKSLYFPSIFVCNINQVTQTALAKMGLEFHDKDHRTIIKHLLWNFAHGLPRLYENPEEGQIEEAMVDIKYLEGLMKKIGWHSKNASFLEKASQPGNDSLIFVRYMQNPPKIFPHPYTSITDYGACSVIYPHLDFVNETTKDRKDRQYEGHIMGHIHYGVRNGKNNGLEIMADAEVFDYAYIHHQSSGFMIALADNRDKAAINQKGFYVSPGKETLVSIKGEGFSITDSARSNFIPEDRNCYHDDEFRFKHFRTEYGLRYSIGNCFYESYMEKVIEKCKCIPFIVTWETNLNLPKCRY